MLGRRFPRVLLEKIEGASNNGGMFCGLTQSVKNLVVGGRGKTSVQTIINHHHQNASTLISRRESCRATTAENIHIISVQKI